MTSKHITVITFRAHSCNVDAMPSLCFEKETTHG